uniref:C3H1-type domain-containing protein n=1 Tax=Cucumis melo TaxID=3656 RepID=A0A9I9CZQ7_CUCME
MIAESMLLNPTAHISTWDSLDDPSAAISSYFSAGHVSPLDSPTAALMDFDSSLWEDPDLPAPVDGFSCDQFRMYEFKVRSCARGRSHDWTKCPYAHTGEKARRRDPRKFNYSGAECPDLRHGCCKKGDACEYAHGTFEIWLHPDRYRTQPCRDGTGCRRRVCFLRPHVGATPDSGETKCQVSTGERNRCPCCVIADVDPVIAVFGLAASVSNQPCNQWRRIIQPISCIDAQPPPG